MPRSMARNLLLLMNGGGGGSGGITYQIRDDFTTTASAPLATPRTAEPGPGTATLVQTDGQFSISSAKLNFPTQASAAWGDQGFYYDALARVAGRTLIAKVRHTTFNTAHIPLAWFTGAALNTTGSNNMAEGIGIGIAGAMFAQAAGASMGVSATSGVDQIYAITQRATGAYYAALGGAFASWTTVYTSSTGSQATLRPGFSNYDAVGYLEYLYVVDMPAPASAADVLAWLTANFPN